MRGSSRAILLALSVALLLCLQACHVAAAPAGDAPLIVHRVPAPRFEARAQRCSSTSQCGSSRFCSNKTCVPRLADGARCSVDRQDRCQSTVCNPSTQRCASNNLPLGSRCTSSLSCSSRSCYFSHCAKKVDLGGICAKDVNCKSGLCSAQAKRCIQSNETPLLPSVPWDRDLSNLKNLEPASGVQLFFTDTGTFDFSVLSLFATMHTQLSFPAVVLSHSSWVGEVKCAANGFSVAFTSADAYARVSKTWDRRERFYIVTHTDGCQAADKTDERTFWMAQGLIFDDAHRTVIVNAQIVAFEEAANEISIRYGQNTNSGSNGNTGATPGGSGGSTSASSSTSTSASSSTSTSASSTSTVVPPSLPTPRIEGPGACSAAMPCDSATFDAGLDGESFYDFANDFDASIRSYMPGLSSYPSSDSSASNRRDVALFVASRSLMLDERGLGDYAMAFGNAVVAGCKAVGNAIVEVATQAADAVVDLANKIAEIVGVLVDKLLALVTPSVDGTMRWNWAPPKVFHSPWGMQARLFSTEKGKDTSKNDEQEKKSTALLSAKKPPAAKLKAVGSLDLFCVDCYMKGRFEYSGDITFSLRTMSVTKLTVDYSGEFHAKMALGFEVHATILAEYRKEIARIPLYLSFMIKDVIAVGPSLVVEFRAAVKFDAEADLLLGGSFDYPAFKTHLDLLDSGRSYFLQAGAPTSARIADAKGALLARASVGFPLSLSLGIKLYPIDFDKAIALTVEPAVVAIAMTATDPDDFKDQGLDACRGMSWKVGLGASVALNLWDWAKYPLGKFDLGPPLAKGCVELFSEEEAAQINAPSTSVDVPVVSVPAFTGRLPTDLSPYCSNPGKGTCACSASADGLTLTCTYTDDSTSAGGMGSFTSPCKGSGSAYLRGGVGGRAWILETTTGSPTAYETTDVVKVAGATSNLPAGIAFNVQLGGAGAGGKAGCHFAGCDKSALHNYAGGWPNGGIGGNTAGGGGGSSELILKSSGRRLIVAAGGGGCAEYQDGQAADASHQYDGELDGAQPGQGESAPGTSADIGGGGGGGLFGGSLGPYKKAGWAGSSTGSARIGAVGAKASAIITWTCAAK